MVKVKNQKNNLWPALLWAVLRLRELWCYVDGNKKVDKLTENELKAMNEALHMI